MASRATMSPAWLGIFAVLSFGGLVLASFASGYHLVMKTAPRGTAAASEDSPAEPRTAGDAPSALAANDLTGPAGGSAAGSTGGPATAAGPPTGAAANDPAEAVVRPNLPPNRAVVRSRPETGGIVARLPSNQRVAVRGRQGQWVRVEFERKGKHVLGWTLETNLQLR
jgi:hypothetical protein